MGNGRGSQPEPEHQICCGKLTEGVAVQIEQDGRVVLTTLDEQERVPCKSPPTT